MKNLLYLALAAIMTLALAACGDDEAPTTQPTQPPVMAIPVEPDIAPPETTAPEQEVFSPIVLVENSDICVKVTGVEEDPIWGYTLHVYLENNTDKELLFTVDEVSINRYMCDPFWAESVSAGMKSNSSISWFDSRLEENSITHVEEISFILRVYDPNDFYAEDLLLERFTITP